MDLRTLWLQWGGTRQSREMLDLESLPYPLCYNVPRSAWLVNQREIFLKEMTHNYCLFVDLILEFDKFYYYKTVNERDTYSAKLHWCVGVGDDSMIENIKCPSERDIVTCSYYSRFLDGYNLISDTIKCGLDDIILKETKLKINNSMICDSFEEINLTCNAVDFLSGFTTLNPGDFISLGTLYCQTSKDTDFIESVEIISDNFNWKVWIIQEKII